MDAKKWSSTLREKHRLRAFKNKVFSKIFGLKKDKYQKAGEYFIMGSFKICTIWQMFLGLRNEGRWDGRYM
jgi:hypothetical protein